MRVAITSTTEVSIDSRAGLSTCCTIVFKRDARGKKAPFVATFTIFLKTKVKRSLCIITVSLHRIFPFPLFLSFSLWQVTKISNISISLRISNSFISVSYDIIALHEKYDNDRSIERAYLLHTTISISDISKRSTRNLTSLPQSKDRSNRPTINAQKPFPKARLSLFRSKRRLGNSNVHGKLDNASGP